MAIYLYTPHLQVTAPNATNAAKLMSTYVGYTVLPCDLTRTDIVTPAKIKTLLTKLADRLEVGYCSLSAIGIMLVSVGHSIGMSTLIELQGLAKLEGVNLAIEPEPFTYDLYNLVVVS